MQYIFGLELEKKLGKERVMEMVLIWRRPQRHLSMEELQQLYDYYSKLLAKEIKRRNLVYKI
ncbi:MAG: hypothetical protein KatS3mg054_0016 [Chloroflexus sp.]|nr:MAG: hypothetical protein KatS3mg054_0016 [Chloroflexus sp.]